MLSPGLGYEDCAVKPMGAAALLHGASVDDDGVGC